MPDWVEALERHVVSVVAGFPRGARPVDEGVAQAVADLLLLFVEDLLRHFFPEEAQVADRGNQAEANGFTGGKGQRPFIAVMAFSLEEFPDGLVGQVAGGNNVRNRSTSLA